MHKPFSNRASPGIAVPNSVASATVQSWSKGIVKGCGADRRVAIRSIPALPDEMARVIISLVQPRSLCVKPATTAAMS
jgi:hypothetical protein